MSPRNEACECNAAPGHAHTKECWESCIQPRDAAMKQWRRDVKAAERAVIKAAIVWSGTAYGSDVEQAHVLERATNTLTDLLDNKPA